MGKHISKIFHRNLLTAVDTLYFSTSQLSTNYISLKHDTTNRYPAKTLDCHFNDDHESSSKCLPVL